MNNGNEILKAQEKEDNIKLLAAQRQMYSEAKNVSAFATFVSLAIPLIVTLLQIYISINYWILFFLALMLLLAGAQLKRRAQKLAKVAACVQQKFDSNIFDMPFDNVCICDCDITQYSMRYLENHDAKEKLLGWYTVPIKGMNGLDAITRCQRQNSKWTKNLATRYFIFEIIVALITATAIIAGIILEHTPCESLFFLLTISEWILYQFFDLNDFRKKSKKLETDMSHYALSTKENIEIIQRDIFEYRSSAVLVPDWFYRVLKKRDDATTSL